MNAADLIIIAVVGLLSALGLKLGFLKPASGIGGLILGVILAVQHSGQVAALLVDYIEAETLRRIAAFGSILVATAVTTRMTAALTKKVLSALVLGWVDHLAGAMAGAFVGIVVAGTAVYILIGADLDPTRDALATSKLAPEISRTSLLSANMPWCSYRAGGAGAESCADLKGLANKLLGPQIFGKMEELLGIEPERRAEATGGSRAGSPEDL